MWTGCVTEQHKDTEESRDGMETPTRIVSFRNKNPPQLQVRVSSMRVRKLPQLLRRTPSPRPAHKTAENTTSSREELLPEAPDNKAEQGLGLHTHSHTHTHTHSHRPPHLHLPLKAACSQPGLSLHPPAPLPRSQTGGENRGPPRRQTQIQVEERAGFQLHPGRRGASVRRGGCSDGCGRSVGRTGTFFFFCPPVLHINKDRDHVTCWRPRPQREGGGTGGGGP